MRCYKGFDKDLKCRGFQYEVGGEYTEDKAELCKSGFHACENPLDVFKYYAPRDGRFCEVDLGEVSDEKDSDSKRVGKRIKIETEIGIKGIVEAGVKFVFDRVDWENSKSTNTGYQSAATNTGNYSAATNTGYQSAATSTGDQSAVTNTGDQSAATSTGNYSVATNTGNYSAATSTGDQSVVANTGNQSAATSTGDQSVATNTGNYSAATNTGKYSAATSTGYYSAATNTGYQSAATNTGNYSAATNTGDQSAASVSGSGSVAMAIGEDSKAKGALGCWIVLSEWIDGHMITVKSHKVDGKTIKADTWYVLKSGKFKIAGV